MSTIVVAPQFKSGPLEITVGNRKFMAELGTKIVRVVRDRAQLAYLLTPDGRIHCVIRQGELPIPSALQAALKSRYFRDS